MKKFKEINDDNFYKKFSPLIGQRFSRSKLESMRDFYDPNKGKNGDLFYQEFITYIGQELSMSKIESMIDYIKSKK